MHGGLENTRRAPFVRSSRSFDYIRSIRSGRERNATNERAANFHHRFKQKTSNSLVIRATVQAGALPAPAYYNNYTRSFLVLLDPAPVIADQ